MMTIHPKFFKVLGVPVPGTKKPRKYPWKKIKALPRWIKYNESYGPEGTTIVKGKNQEYKIVCSGTQVSSQNRTGHGRILSGSYTSTSYSYKYYSRKRGLQ